MADPAELSPAELDRLEDALEALNDLDEVADESPRVRTRLGDYRRVLTVAREALPPQEPPASVLAAVMVEARAAVEAERVETTAAASPSVWTRLRRVFLVPGLALAGAAALVMLVLVPAERSTESESTVARSDKRADAPQRAVEADEPAAAVPGDRARDGAAAGEKLEASVEDKPAVESAARADADEEAAKSVEAPPASVVGGTPPSGASTTTADPTASPRWDIIARGDRARQKANCTLARKEYDQALADADARVRARAHAGIGLCQAWAGDAEGAADSYARARELDVEIAKFIEEERPRSARPPAQAKPAKKAKAAGPKASPPSVDQQNAFED